MATPPQLTDVLNQVLTGIQTILYDIASAIASNAQVIATVVVVGAIAFMVLRFGTRIFRGVTGWLRGFM